jgi:hypothetical protein
LNVNDKTGLRLDMATEGDRNERGLWIDVKSMHPSADSYAASTRKFLLAAYAIEQLNGNRRQSSTAIVYTPALARAQALKHEKYLPMINAKRAQLLRTRSGTEQTPLFLAPIISHHGEFSSDTFKLINILGKRLRDKAHADPHLRYDGRSPKFLEKLFAETFKNQLIVALVKGVGRMLAVAGAPLGCTNRG